MSPQIIKMILLFLKGTVLEPIADAIDLLIRRGATIQTIEQLAEAIVSEAEKLYPSAHPVLQTIYPLLRSIADTIEAIVAVPVAESAVVSDVPKKSSKSG